MRQGLPSHMKKAEELLIVAMDRLSHKLMAEGCH